MYTTSLDQYETEALTLFRSENPETTITDEEWFDCYPKNSRLPEWVEEIREKAWSGEVIAPVVLDELCKRGNELFVLYLRKNIPSSVPEGYLTLQAREKQDKLSWR